LLFHIGHSKAELLEIIRRATLAAGITTIGSTKMHDCPFVEPGNDNYRIKHSSTTAATAEAKTRKSSRS